MIRPLTKPSQPVMPDEKLLSRERAAKEAAEKAAAAQRAARIAEIEAQKKEESSAQPQRATRSEQHVERQSAGGASVRGDRSAGQFFGRPRRPEPRDFGEKRQK